MGNRLPAATHQTFRPKSSHHTAARCAPDLASTPFAVHECGSMMEHRYRTAGRALAWSIQTGDRETGDRRPPETAAETETDDGVTHSAMKCMTCNYIVVTCHTFFWIPVSFRREVVV